MSVQPEQSYDLNGDPSNSYTRAEAKQVLSTRKDLTPEQRKWWENRTQCLRGDAYRQRKERKVTLLGGTERTVKRESVPGGGRQQQGTPAVQQGQQGKSVTNTKKTAGLKQKKTTEPPSQTKKPAASATAPAKRPASTKSKRPKI